MISKINFTFFPNRYLYGHKIGDDFNLSEISETYTVADKYLVVGLNDVLFNHIKESLDIFNCCLIYDQLIKIQKDDLPILKHVKSFIKYNTKKVVEHEFFTKIDENTLLDLLMMDELSVSEIELLNSCARWVKEELLREGLISNAQNKREIFKPIKNYIKFSVLSLEQMKVFGEIYDLLPAEETVSFLAHLLNGRPLSIECKTKRKTINLYRIDSNLFNDKISLSQFVTSISANQTCFIQMFSTSLHKSIAFLELSIEKNGKELKLNFEKKLIDDYWCFNFEDGFEMNSDVNYRLIFTFNQAYFGTEPNKLSSYTRLVQEKPKFFFNLTSSNNYNCIEKIDFYVYEN